MNEDNNFKGYVEEIIRHVLAHVQQVLTHGCCNCNSGGYNPQDVGDHPEYAQTICFPAERLASIQRGEPQYYKKAHPASIYEYQWELDPDGNEPF